MYVEVFVDAKRFLTSQGLVVQGLDNAIQWMSVDKTNHALCWLVIYPADRVSQSLNNLGQYCGQ